MFTDLEGDRDFFRVGEDSSLVILPPEERLLNEDEGLAEEIDIEIPMLLVKNQSCTGSQSNIFQEWNQCLNMEKYTLNMVVDKFIKGYVKDMDR